MNCLDAALKYAERGWPVYAPSGKDESYSTKNPARIRKYHSKNDVELAIDIGLARLVVLTVEGDEGINSLIKLGMPPETLRAKVSDTATDLFFQAPQARLRSGEIAKGLKLQADIPAYAYVPPNNGSVWINGDDEPIAPFPENLVSAAKEAEQAKALAQALSGVIVLPSDHVPFIEAATKIFPLFAERKELFVRGDVIVELLNGKASPIKPQAFRSRIEHLGPTFRHRSSKDGPKLVESRCPVDVADALLETREAHELLPPLRLIVNQPLLTEENGSLILLHPGYNSAAGGVFVLGHETPEDVPLDTACGALLDLLAEFDFVTTADKSRAAASLITPALTMGYFLLDRIPLDVREADKSQAGKGLMQKMTCGIYGEEPDIVAQKKGGVGSFDESLAEALITGKPFVSIDNWRGKIDSPLFEAILTATGPVGCRVPHKGSAQIDPRGMLFQLTSNGVELTNDLANRSSIVRIKKKPRNTQFRPLLVMIEEQQPFYLGCVHAVVREWHQRGKPRNQASEHDFREWEGTLGWIVQELFGFPVFLKGHREIQEQVSSPALVWLREVVLAVQREGLTCEMSASRIFAFCKEHSIDIPGARLELDDEETGARRVGQLMGQVFRDAECDRVEVDGVPICRLESKDDAGRPRKFYVFGEVPRDGS